MANKEKNSIFERPFMRIVLTCLGAVLSTIVLGFSAMTILEVYNNSYDQSYLFFFAHKLILLYCYKDSHSTRG